MVDVKAARGTSEAERRNGRDAIAIAPAPADPRASEGGGVRDTARRVLRFFSLRNASALYVFLLIFAIFALWIPETFLTRSSWVTLIDNGAVTSLVAIGLVIPLAAGVFDLAIGMELGFGSVLVAWFLAREHIPAPAAILFTILVACLIGLISSVLIVVVKIDSFIATLGMSSILTAAITWVTGGQQILGLGSGFQSLGTNKILGLTLPVYIMIVVAALAWYVLECTPVGRRVYATGGGIDAARLSGIRTPLVIVGALLASGAIAAIGGVLVTSTIATGDPTVGPSYMLPAFSAAFLGSTQFRRGRCNVWGTVVAVYVLAVGVKGLQLAGAPTWIPDFFNGAALLVAVGVAKSQSRRGRPSAVGRLLRFGRPSKAD